MNTHLKQLWAAMKLPEKLQKSYKFFCRGLDIRVPEIMQADVWQFIRMCLIVTVDKFLKCGGGCRRVHLCSVPLNEDMILSSP